MQSAHCSVDMIKNYIFNIPLQYIFLSAPIMHPCPGQYPQNCYKNWFPTQNLNFSFESGSLGTIYLV